MSRPGCPERSGRLYRGRVRVAVLVSGSGTMLDAMLRRVCRWPWCVRTGPVPDWTSPTRKTSRSALVDRRRFGASAPTSTRVPTRVALTETLREAEIDLVAMAGFGTVVDQPLHDAFAGRILNTHPALLPAFPGGTPWRRRWRPG